ncbi:MAG: hypothetical protein WCJ25_01855 [Candidatus Moraniibacteriota bacterium]
MAYVILIIGIVASIGLTLFAAVFLSSFAVMAVGAPYVPCSAVNRGRIRAAIRGRKRVLELGSGDGRVMIDLVAENGIVHGYEINPFLVWISRWRLWKLGLSRKTAMYRRNFWKYDFGEYDAVCVYGISYMMERLEKKLLEELPAGALVVSVGFPFPNWEPARQDGTVWVYEKD